MKKNWFIICATTMLLSVVLSACNSEVNDGNNTVPKIVMALQDKSPFEADEYLLKKGYARLNMDSFPGEFESIAPIYIKPKKLVELPDSARNQALKNDPYERIVVASLGGESTPYYISGEQTCSSMNQAFNKYKSWIDVLENQNKNPDLWFASITRELAIIPFNPDDWFETCYCGGPIGEEYLNQSDSLWVNGNRDDFRRTLFWVKPDALLVSEVREVYADEHQRGHMVQTQYPASLSAGNREKTVSFSVRRGNMSQYLLPNSYAQ